MSFRQIVTVAMLFLGAALVAKAQAFAPADAQVQAARAAADRYWRATDAGDSSAAYAALDDQFHHSETPENFAAVSRHFTQVAGPLIERRIARTTWHKDTPAEGGSVYAAYDIVARYQNIDRYCGYLIVRQASPSGSFAVSHVEETYLDNDNAQNAVSQGQSADNLWARMAADSCPGWQQSWALPAQPAQSAPAAATQH
jgi:hypothetical protein